MLSSAEEADEPHAAYEWCTDDAIDIEFCTQVANHFLSVLLILGFSNVLALLAFIFWIL